MKLSKYVLLTFAANLVTVSPIALTKLPLMTLDPLIIVNVCSDTKNKINNGSRKK